MNRPLTSPTPYYCLLLLLLTCTIQSSTAINDQIEYRPPVVATIAVRPSSGRASLILNQPLHFQCEQVGRKNANFFWYKQDADEAPEKLLHPDDDNVEIVNDKLTISKPNYQSIGNYICRLLDETGHPIAREFAVIRLRAPPYIDEFALSSTGRSHSSPSVVVTDGERLELTCSVRDTAQVNITWLKSQTPEDEKTMVPIVELSSGMNENSNNNNNDASVITTTQESINLPYLPQTIQANQQEQSVIIEKVDNYTKKLIIEQVRPEHRAYYVCMADNGVTERSRRIILIRVKDKLIALWPFLGIIAELFILFTIIHIWETQRAYKELNSTSTVLIKGSVPSSSSVAAAAAANKRPASGSSVPCESVPLTGGKN